MACAICSGLTSSIRPGRAAGDLGCPPDRRPRFVGGEPVAEAKVSAPSTRGSGYDFRQALTVADPDRLRLMVCDPNTEKAANPTVSWRTPPSSDAPVVATRKRPRLRPSPRRVVRVTAGPGRGQAVLGFN